jgi:hypothetical protein
VAVVDAGGLPSETDACASGQPREMRFRESRELSQPPDTGGA